MSGSLEQHQRELLDHRRRWEAKPLIREIYADFYRRILALTDRSLPGRWVEIGAGIGTLKTHCPEALGTDLFPHPWLDVVCDGYELPFRDGCLSHLILVDVFHHLERPAAFLREAGRVLGPAGRLILVEPYMSLTCRAVFGLFHHEPVAWREPIEKAETPPPRPRSYYAAQGNATRLFFGEPRCEGLSGWELFHRETFSGPSYLLSGGFSKPALYPASWLGGMRRLDALLGRWPDLFAARCLVGLRAAKA